MVAGSNHNTPIRIALVGAGVFARDAHLPSLLRLSHLFEIVAIFSRTETSATALAEQVPYPVEVFTRLASSRCVRTDIDPSGKFSVFVS